MSRRAVSKPPLRPERLAPARADDTLDMVGVTGHAVLVYLCVSPAELSLWVRDNRREASNGFCHGADRRWCREQRDAGRCSRTDAQWTFLLAHDARVEAEDQRQDRAARRLWRRRQADEPAG